MIFLQVCKAKDIQINFEKITFLTANNNDILYIAILINNGR